MPIIVGAHLSVECKVGDTLSGDVVQHIPCLLRRAERSVKIDVADAAAVTELVKARADVDAVFEGGGDPEREPLIAVQRKVQNNIRGEEGAVRFQKFDGSGFSWDLLDVDHVISYCLTNGVLITPRRPTFFSLCGLYGEKNDLQNQVNCLLYFGVVGDVAIFYLLVDISLYIVHNKNI